MYPRPPCTGPIILSAKLISLLEIPPLSINTPASTNSGIVRSENFCTVACIIDGITPSGDPLAIKARTLDNPSEIEIGIFRKMNTTNDINNTAATIFLFLLSQFHFFWIFTVFHFILDYTDDRENS